MLPAVFLFAASMFPEIGERIYRTGDIGTLSGLVGVKTFGVFFSYIFYLKTSVNSVAKNSSWFHENAILMIMLMIYANLYFVNWKIDG